MPGYVMHLAEAELLLSAMSKAGRAASPAFSNLFRLGNLLPDTKRKQEKAASHFWSPKDAGKLALAPDLDLFLERYGSALKGPVMLGYYAHLHLDSCFVHDFWKKEFSFLNEDGREEERRDRIARVRLNQSGCMIPVSEFFSLQYYYGDYSRMNRFFRTSYSLALPEWDETISCPVEEVQVEELHQVLRELRLLIEGAYDVPGDQTLQVFDRDALDAFIRRTAKEVLPMLLDRL